MSVESKVAVSTGKRPGPGSGRAFLIRSLFSERGKRLFSFLLAVLSILLVTALYYTQNPFLEAFEDKTYDLRFSKLRGPIAPDPRIAIIAIDDKSIRELGRFPWSRSEYVPLLRQLSAAGAKAVLFDAFYPETQSAAVDRQFAEAIRRAGNVALAVTFEFDDRFRITGDTRSIPVIERAAARIGHINMLPESDGVNRRNLLLIRHDGKEVPSLGLVGAMMAQGESTFTADPFAVRVGAHAVPVDANDAMWIDYTGAAGHYPYYSFVDVMKGRVPAEKLKDKVLFVGATALGIYDLRVTPFSGNVPGVEVHATVADDILNDRFIQRSAVDKLFDLGMIVLLGLLAFYLTVRISWYQAIPATVVLVGGYLWASYAMFRHGHWVSMIYPPLAAMLALLAGGGFRYLVLERSAREMRAMFSSYVSDKVVSRLEKEHKAARIGGDNKEVTILFTDIKGFTTFSERHTPQEVVGRLNEYLATMVQLVYQFDGTVDKFIGDGIMMYWGAPLAQPDHAQRAISCALAMKQAMADLTAKWEREGLEPFVIRGGAQSGEVVAGNIGSRGKKMEYTVIGDTVNQAARLEGTAKYYGVSFLVGERTYAATRDRFRYRELDRIRVVGKQIPVAVYELRGALDDPEDRLAEQFCAAMKLYREQRWHEAEDAFAGLLAQFPDDRPSALYVDRCRHFREVPPPSDWDGVFNRREK
jgi:adenylate cyclase